MSKPPDKWDKPDAETPPDPPPDPDEPAKPPDKWGDKPRPEPPEPEPPEPVPPEPEPPRPEPPEPEPPPGEVIQIPEGSGPLVFKNRRDILICGERGPVTITGPDDEDGLWLHECENVVVEDLNFRGLYRGVRITDSEQISLARVHVEDCEQQGFLTVNVAGLVLDHCSARDIRDEHACYLSENFRDGQLRDCDFRNTGGSCFQANAEGADNPITGVVLTRCIIDAEFAIAAMGAEVRVEDSAIVGRINVDTVRGWEARVILDNTDFSGNVNEFNGSTVVEV